MRVRLIGGPYHGTAFEEIPDATPEIHVPDADDPNQYHTYARSDSGLFLYDHRMGALGRDPGQGGYFVPPAWL